MKLNKCTLFAIILSLSYTLNAGIETQTDWTGIDGVWGPVSEWQNDYYSCSNIECNYDPLITLIPVLAHLVDGNVSMVKSICTNDIDGNGTVDIIGSVYYSDEIAWWKNIDGSGINWLKFTLDDDFEGANCVYTDDVNGDGRIDIIGAGWSCITWWENDENSDSSWVEHPIVNDFTDAESVCSADINGDGKIDIIGAAQGLHEISWWRNENGSGEIWTKHVVAQNFVDPVSVVAADINEDGYIDIIGGSVLWDGIVWWENEDGTGTSWTMHEVEGVFRGICLYCDDINGDGHLDVLGASSYYGDIEWWENNDGSGTSWTKHDIDDYSSVKSIYSTDLDGDGDVDVLGCRGNQVTWWENADGSGTSWIEHTVSISSNSTSIFSGDFDGDGFQNILSASYQISWWETTVLISEGVLESSVLEIQGNPDWQVIDWTGSEPSGTSLSFQIRASSDPDSMGEWSETLTSPCILEGILIDGDRYFQYRTTLTTDEQYVTPVLYDISVVWLPLTGTQEDTSETIDSYILYDILPNPSIGHTTLLFSVPVESNVNLQIFDLSGRMLRSYFDRYETGEHQVILDELKPGVYFAKLICGDFMDIQRFVLIE